MELAKDADPNKNPDGAIKTANDILADLDKQTSALASRQAYLVRTKVYQLKLQAEVRKVMQGDRSLNDQLPDDFSAALEQAGAAMDVGAEVEVKLLKCSWLQATGQMETSARLLEDVKFTLDQFDDGAAIKHLCATSPLSTTRATKVAPLFRAQLRSEYHLIAADQQTFMTVNANDKAKRAFLKKALLEANASVDDARASSQKKTLAFALRKQVAIVAQDPSSTQNQLIAATLAGDEARTCLREASVQAPLVPGKPPYLYSWNEEAMIAGSQACVHLRLSVEAYPASRNDKAINRRAHLEAVVDIGKKMLAQKSLDASPAFLKTLKDTADVAQRALGQP